MNGVKVICILSLFLIRFFIVLNTMWNEYHILSFWLAKIYGKDKAIREVRETFVDAIKNIEVEMANEPMLLDSDDNGSEINFWTKFVIQNVKKEYVHEPSSKKAKKPKVPKVKEKRKMQHSVDLASTFKLFLRTLVPVFKI